MKKKTDGNMPTTVQNRFPNTEALGSANSKPRCREYDLMPGERNIEAGFLSDFMQSVRPNEQTFTVRKPGNKVTEGGNY